MEERYRQAYYILFSSITDAGRKLQEHMLTHESGKEQEQETIGAVIMELRARQQDAEEIIIAD